MSKPVKTAPKKTLAKKAESAPKKKVSGGVSRKKAEKTPEIKKESASHKVAASKPSDQQPPVAEKIVEAKQEPVLAPMPVETVSEAEGDQNISMKPPIIIRELATKLGCKPFQIIHELMEVNIFATLNQAIDEEIARKVCEKRGFTFNVEKREKGAGVHKPEPVVAPPPPPVKAAQTKGRPPVVTFMGHVDHGKTSLLDAIRQARVAAGEAGGITQHIGAYTVTHQGHPITFLDTPGHEAFTAMRARGANVTDIAVIVVAADDGIMPQTLEAIRHAQAAKVAIMVAINKIDMPGANVDKVKGQLQEKGLVPEDWGGQTICCPVSATKKVGIDKLLEMIQLQAEVLELKAQPTGDARGTVIEAQVEQGRGSTATVLVRQGTLKTGDAFICGPFWGKAKALVNDLGKNVKEAGPSMPVKIVGFLGTPSPGEEFTVVPNEREARQIAEERTEAARVGKLNEPTSAVTLENIFDSIKEGQKKVLNLVLKTDVQGSLEAIMDSLKKIKSEKAEVNFILAAVGPINESDILLAKASNAVVIGFGTKTDNAAAAAAKKENVQIKLYSIIYELIDQVKEAMAGLLDPETRESQIGTALVKKVFELSKFPVAGCMVQSGRLSRTGRARVVRKKQPIYDGAIVTLKRFQDDASEVRAGLECGVRLGNFSEYEEGDVIECYVLEKVPQSL
ncbi:MAG: translation initiation factor IF-2 [bacterium]